MIFFLFWLAAICCAAGPPIAVASLDPMTLDQPSAGKAAYRTEKAGVWTPSDRDLM